MWVYYNPNTLSNYEGLFNIRDSADLFFEAGIQPTSSDVQLSLLQGAFTSSSNIPFS